jgi:DNA-binding transcriptional ArsR family regulator
VKTPLEILSEYQSKVSKLKAIGSQHKEIQPLTLPDVLFIKAILHPTAKKESKEVTRKLIMFLCDRGIVTAQEIYDELGYADKPVLHRLKKFREHGLVRRESKKYYMPTPRMLELRERYLERVCGE